MFGSWRELAGQNDEDEQVVDPFVVVPIMSHIAARFAQGDPTDSTEIAARIGMHESLVGRILERLVTAKLLNRVEGEGESSAFTPARSADEIHVRELLVLGEKIKAKGIAPLTFQGQYPYYAVRGFLFPWAISLGGLEVFRDAQNLQPGAWNSPAMVKAAEMLDELRRRGLLQEGAVAMSHTEAQMEFVQGHAAMVPCGTWLHSEMKTAMPPGFEMAYFLPPSAPNPQGDPSIVEIGVEPWIITRASPNPDLAADFFRYMTSLPKAKQFVREKGTLMALEGSDQTELPPHLIGPAAVLRDAKATWTPLYAKWYPDLETELRNAVNALMQGNITPRECMDRVERKAQETRDDPNIPKLVAK